MNDSTECPAPLPSAHNGKCLKLMRGLQVCKQTPWSSASLATDLALAQYFAKVCTVVLEEAAVDYDASFNSLKTRRVRQWSEWSGKFPAPCQGKLPQHVIQPESYVFRPAERNALQTGDCYELLFAFSYSCRRENQLIPLWILVAWSGLGQEHQLLMWV